MPTHYQGTGEEKLALDLYIKLMRASDSVTARLTELRTLKGLSISQFGTLEVLYHLGPMCQKELGAKLLKSGGNMTMVLDNLEKKGYVERFRDEEDRRFVRVQLTSTGEKKLMEVLPHHVEKIVEMMNVLTPGEQEELCRLTKKLGCGVSSA